MIRAAVLSIALLGFCAQGAVAADILIHDAKSSPESLTVAPDGSVIAGSASSPYVYRVKKGATTAEVFIDVSAEAGSTFLGQLADGATNTLWTCQMTPVAGANPPQRHSYLHGFDLATGKEKLRWQLPGDAALCNDFVVGPDKALYISDTLGSKIYKLAPGAAAPTLFMDNRLLNGIDGITFLNGVLYVNNVIFNKIYRIPVDASGKPGAPVDIWTDAPIKGPDGMRAANGKLFVAENGAGKISALTITGDTAHVTVLKDGLVTPTGIEPAGNELWFTERGTGKVGSLPMPK
jgi:hypothetical protein